MDFANILKRSWEITKKYRFIWWLGLLAIAAEGSGFSGFPDFSAIENSKTLTSPVSDSIENISVPNDPSFYIGIALAGLIFLTILLAIIYISNSASAGLISSIENIEHDKTTSFSKAFHEGKKFFWRIFGLKILLALITIIIALVLISPIAVAVVSPSLPTIILAVFVAIIAVVTIIPVSLYIHILRIITSRVIVIENLAVMNAIGKAQTMISKNLGNLFISWLISVVVNLLVGLVMLLAILLASGIILVFGLLFYGLFRELGAIVYGCFAITAVILACLFLSGIVTSFISTYWTLVFNKLKE